MSLLDLPPELIYTIANAAIAGRLSRCCRILREILRGSFESVILEHGMTVTSRKTGAITRIYAICGVLTTNSAAVAGGWDASVIAARTEIADSAALYVSWRGRRELFVDRGVLDYNDIIKKHCHNVHILCMFGVQTNLNLAAVYFCGRKYAIVPSPWILDYMLHR